MDNSDRVPGGGTAGRAGPSALAVQKRSLRKAALARWRRMPAPSLLAAAAAAGARLASLDCWHSARAVAAFMAMADELPTWDLIAAARGGGKIVALPRVVPGPSRIMEFRVPEGAGQLRKSSYGLWEPDPARCPLLDPRQIDLVLAPGVAFDRHGGRLGRGAGYYDRYLARLDRSQTAIIGWTGADFVYEQLPKGDHDVPVDMVVTPVEVIEARPDPGKEPRIRKGGKAPGRN